MNKQLLKNSLGWGFIFWLKTRRRAKLVNSV